MPEENNPSNNNGSEEPMAEMAPKNANTTDNPYDTGPAAPANVDADPVVQVPNESVAVAQSNLLDGAQPKKKKTLLFVIIAAVVALLVGGGIAAYALWYQNPKKVLSDAVSHAINADTVAFTGEIQGQIDKDSSLSIKIDGKSSSSAYSFDGTLTVKYQGKDIAVKAAIIDAGDGALYVKAGGIKKAVDSVFGVMGSALLGESVSQVIDKIDDQWVKITPEDLKEMSESTATMQDCGEELRKKIAGDKSYLTELSDVYKEHDFVDPGKKAAAKEAIDGVKSYRYDVTVDEAAAKEFAKEVKKTKLFKEAQKCTDGTAVDSVDSTSKNADSSEPSLQVWVSTLSHEFTKLRIESTQDGKTSVFEVLPIFNKEVKVAAPSSSVTLKDLKADIEAIMNQYTASGLPGSSTDDYYSDYDSIEL